jgi:hypothetical protein
MSGVEFNEPQIARSGTIARKSSFFARLVIGTGLAKDEKGAQGVLLITALFLLGVMAAVLITGVFGGSQAPLNEAEVLRG